VAGVSAGRNGVLRQGRNQAIYRASHSSSRLAVRENAKTAAFRGRPFCVSGFRVCLACDCHALAAPA
jgi:hypothetical protein